MSIKEEAETFITKFTHEVGTNAANYVYLIPGWAPEDFAMAIRWIRSQLWEGFFVAYKIDETKQHVLLKTWEFGEEEPSWQQAS
ncbi:hypothetical protein [Pandoraea pnomenusa]|uniref:hypothetical protein n=1 Tax=Pandoraea pnomenusa TaxID=93220 RepID=UPI003342C88D